jgi:hypothetical protein
VLENIKLLHSTVEVEPARCSRVSTCLTSKTYLEAVLRVIDDQQAVQEYRHKNFDSLVWRCTLPKYLALLTPSAQDAIEPELVGFFLGIDVPGQIAACWYL